MYWAKSEYLINFVWYNWMRIYNGKSIWDAHDGKNWLKNTKTEVENGLISGKNGTKQIEV